MTYTVSQALTVVGAVEASYGQLWSLYYPLIQKNPALTSQKLQDLDTRLRRMSPTSMVRIGDDSIAGIVRYGFGTAKANIIMAKQMLASPSASANMAKIANLIDTAKAAVRALQSLSGAVRTVEGWSRSNPSRSASSLVQINGFGQIGFEPIEWLAAGVLIGGIIIFVVGVSVLVDTLQRGQNAQIALRVAREACQASGHPCTQEEFQAAYERAARAQAEINPPILTPRPGSATITDSINDLVFWGGMAAVVALIGYGLWTTLPAAKAFRARHSHRPQLPRYGSDDIEDAVYY